MLAGRWQKSDCWWIKSNSVCIGIDPPLTARKRTPVSVFRSVNEEVSRRTHIGSRGSQCTSVHGNFKVIVQPHIPNLLEEAVSQRSNDRPTRATRSLRWKGWCQSRIRALSNRSKEGLIMDCTTSARFAYSRLNILSIMVFTLMSTLWGGCAMTTTLDGKRLQGFGTDGTSVLGGVSYILSIARRN